MSYRNIRKMKWKCGRTTQNASKSETLNNSSQQFDTKRDLPLACKSHRCHFILNLINVTNCYLNNGNFVSSFKCLFLDNHAVGRYRRMPRVM